MYGNRNKETVFVPIRMAQEITGLGQEALRKYADKNEIECYRTPSGQRKFNKNSLLEFISSSNDDSKVKDIPRKNYLYARVSSKKQMDDLSRQVEYLRRPEYSDFSLVTDIGSGINFKRKGLQTILDSCIQGIIGTIVIAHRDRLCRFGYDLLKSVVTKSGGNIKVLDDHQNKSSEQELAEDLLSIIHIYSCRQMGKRSYSKVHKIEKNSSKIVCIAEGED
jgi:putative resolvase